MATAVTPAIDARVDERAAAGAPRLEFLDALRGIAAFAVVFGHRGEGLISGFVHFDAHVFRFGQFGVVLFFLCSGFIIPASLERHGSLARFWISRFFRLFPLYWATLAAVLVLHALGTYALPADYSQHEVVTTAVNTTMMQAFVSLPLALGLSWTLAFEMGFYLMVTGLFLAGAQRRSLPLAATLLALTSALAVHSADGPTPVVGLLLLATAAAAACVVRGRSIGGLLAAGVVAALSVPLLFNGYYAPWYSVVLFASLFTGTVVYRWAHAEIPAWQGAALLAAATVVTTVASAIAADRPSFAPTFLAAYAVFGAAFALRHRTFPAWLLRLGVISYSLYLLHPLVYAVLGDATGSGTVVRVISFVGALALSVLVAELSYRFLEQPMMALGRRASARIVRPAPPVKSAAAAA
ncbi:MAG: acyltransferase [Conexibacter sp.]|nr:acyltransferase [Conexibacter sp.]